METAVIVAIVSAVGVVGASVLQGFTTRSTARSAERREAALRAEQEAKWEREAREREEVRKFEADREDQKQVRHEQEAELKQKKIILSYFVEVASVSIGALHLFINSRGESSSSGVPLLPDRIDDLNRAVGNISLYLGERHLNESEEISRQIQKIHADIISQVNWQSGNANARLDGIAAQLHRLARLPI